MSIAAIPGCVAHCQMGTGDHYCHFSFDVSLWFMSNANSLHLEQLKSPGRVVVASAAKPEYCTLVPEVINAGLIEDPDFGVMSMRSTPKLCANTHIGSFLMTLLDQIVTMVCFTPLPSRGFWFVATFNRTRFATNRAPNSTRGPSFPSSVALMFEGMGCWGDHSGHCTSEGDVAITGQHYAGCRSLDIC